MDVQYNQMYARVVNNVKIEVYETGFADLDSKWRQQDVCSPFSRLYYVISGKGYLKIHHSEESLTRLYELKPGCVYLIPNGLSYDYFCEDKLEKVYIHINVMLQNGLELFCGCNSFYEMPIDVSRLEQMKQWMQDKSPENSFHLQGEVYHTVAEFMKFADVEDKLNRKYSEVVTKVFSLLPGIKISASVQELAGSLNVSESTLTKRFKKETGMSIGRYHEQLIMNRARQFLAIGDLSVGEIAEELGFGDQFYFCKYFKQRQGMPPSVYKSNYKNAY